MKKIIALLTAAFVLAAAFSGCAEKTPQSTGEDSAAMPQTQASTQTLPSESAEQTSLEDNYEFPSQSLSDPSNIRYTDVPGMPTQDFVLSFEDVRNEKTHDVAVEEPDKLTSNALFDIYNFVQTEQKKPVRYFDEDVQKAVEELLPNGASPDILHMTEFMQIIPEKTEDKNCDAKATVIIDADYTPNRLVIVMIGNRQACKDDQDLDAIEWTPLKASVTEAGKIEFVIPAELVESVEGEDTIFSVLTDRIGTRGGVIRYEGGEIVITYPSKTADDIKLMILIPHEAPMQVVPGSIDLECIELVLNLTVDVFALTSGLAAFGFDNPDGAVLFHDNVVSIEKPLLPDAVHIDNGKILLPGIAVFVYPFNIVSALTMLLKQHFTGAADNTGSKTGSVLLVGIGEIFRFVLHIRVITEEILFRNMECAETGSSLT